MRREVAEGVLIHESGFCQSNDSITTIRRQRPDPTQPVEAYMLFGSFADKTAVNLRRNTRNEPARISAFRQRLRNRLAGCGQVREHVTRDIGETRECFNRGRREPGQ